MSKVLILGSKGMLGGELLRVFGNAGVGWDREETDVTDFGNAKFQILNFKPSIIINCVAYNDVDGAEDNQDLAFLLNAEVVKNLSVIANELNIPLVHFSTNYVFDGQAGEYKEDAQPKPLSVYAKSKYQGEQNLLTTCKKPYLVRTAVIFGPKGLSEKSKKSFVDLMLDLSQKSDTIKAVEDEVNSITYAADLAGAVKKITTENFAYGIYHITNSGSGSWYDMAKEIFSIMGKNINLIPVPSSAFPRKAIRPKKSILLNSKLPQLRTWQSALKEFLTSDFNP